MLFLYLKPNEKKKLSPFIYYLKIFLHVLGDALGNVGVIVSGLIIYLTSFSWRFYFDPIVRYSRA